MCFFYSILTNAIVTIGVLLLIYEYYSIEPPRPDLIVVFDKTMGLMQASGVLIFQYFLNLTNKFGG